MLEIQRLESIAHDRLESATVGEQHVEKEKLKIVAEKQALEDLQAKVQQSEDKAFQLQQAAQNKLGVNQTDPDC